MRMSTTQSSGVEFAGASENGRNMRKPMPMRMSESPALIGVEGCRVPSFIHSDASTGASTMTKNAGMSWIQLIGISQPKIERLS
ncbi:Uncharacterised protein [Mycobacteroides abscessus subsp. abscessus]|nr:Uncharacterised protein [Mycobacteroides abscessus subsp. abscessus]